MRWWRRREDRPPEDVVRELLRTERWDAAVRHVDADPRAIRTGTVKRLARELANAGRREEAIALSQRVRAVTGDPHLDMSTAILHRHGNGDRDAVRPLVDSAYAEGLAAAQEPRFRMCLAAREFGEAIAMFDRHQHIRNWCTDLLVTALIESRAVDELVGLLERHGDMNRVRSVDRLIGVRCSLGIVDDLGPTPIDVATRRRAMVDRGEIATLATLLRRHGPRVLDVLGSRVVLPHAWQSWPSVNDPVRYVWRLHVDRWSGRDVLVEGVMSVQMGEGRLPVLTLPSRPGVEPDRPVSADAFLLAIEAWNAIARERAEAVEPGNGLAPPRVEILGRRPADDALIWAQGWS